jgi:membrane dipeptidase
MDHQFRLDRRRLLQAAVACVGSTPWLAAAQQPVAISDMHSHYGMILRRLSNADPAFADELRAQRVALVAWKMIADGRWIRASSYGIEQVGEPAPGELSVYFYSGFDRLRSYLDAQKIKTVLTPADVDACLAGQPGVVLASEGADFLEGRVEALDAAYAKGLRHLQLVHYIRTPVGDFQTKAPVHNGLSAMGQQLVRACNAKGVLVDLAHSSPAAVEQALDISRAPTVWSHGWVDGDGGNWQDPYGYLKRRLSVALARRIAAKDGVIGLWGLGLSRPGFGYPLGAGDTRSYAREIARLADLIGPDHVAFGSDIEGVGSTWVFNSYGHLRSVIEHLQGMKLDAAVIDKLAHANYARVLKKALVPIA